LRRARGSHVGVALVLCVLLGCGESITATPAAAAGARAPGSAPSHRPHAPSAPPLLSGSSAYAASSQSGAGSNGESEPESAAAGEDPLVRNGLGSPLCRMAGSELSGSAAGNCRTSGFVASAAPSEDYSFDTNIDTTLGVSIDAMLQDYVVRPAWMLLVWLVHSLLVVLEWAYTLELLRGPLAGGLGQSLRAAQSQFTAPWMVSALAFAAVLAAYQGIVRRRVAQTLGEAAAMLAMIAGALVVIADPSGTVGSLSRWAQEASVGSFGAISSGSSARPYHALAQSMQELYAASIQAPWCFMEFGNVGWCNKPARLDPRLETAAQRIAAKLQAQARSGASTGGLSSQALEHRAQLLRQSHTNGEIFLALPANGPLRNSVKEHTSLLYVLCGGAGDATSCRGPTASEAEFRANSGTLPRLAGVLLIALGVSGMLLLVGFVTVRLLEAATISVLFLLLAPAAALAPAVGEAGRRMFRSWAARLLGAAAAKLLWSILLGALLACMHILLSLEGLGWLVQWMLSGALWWGVFLRRHALLEGAAGHQWMQGAQQASLTRRAEDKLTTTTRQTVKAGGKAAGKAVWRRISPRRPRDLVKPRDQEEVASVKRGPLERITDEVAERLAASAPPPRQDHRARRNPRRAKSHHSRTRSVAERLQELASAHAEALTDGDRRRAISLQLRMQRVRGQMSASAPPGARATSAAGPAAQGTPQAASAKQGAQSARADRARRWDAHPVSRSESLGAGRNGDAAAVRRRRADLDRDIAQRKEDAENPIMRDAIEVAQRRKRQLGWSSKEEQH
jgi:hypothetical protein